MPSMISGPKFIREDERGTFVEVVNCGSWDTVILGKAPAGVILGNHFHHLTTVVFFLASGKARVIVGKDIAFLGSNEGVTFLPKEFHRVEFLEDSSYLILKDRSFDPRDTF